MQRNLNKNIQLRIFRDLKTGNTGRIPFKGNTPFHFPTSRRLEQKALMPWEDKQWLSTYIINIPLNHFILDSLKIYVFKWTLN